jgi:hypothetical protein
VEILQVLEGVHPQAADLVSIEKTASRREGHDAPSLVSASAAAAAPAGDRLPSCHQSSLQP